MNMQSKVVGERLNCGAVECAADLLVVALEIIDFLPLPGEVGAHLDHAINLLRKAGGEAPLATLDFSG